MSGVRPCEDDVHIYGRSGLRPCEDDLHIYGRSGVRPCEDDVHIYGRFALRSVFGDAGRGGQDGARLCNERDSGRAERFPEFALQRAIRPGVASVVSQKVSA